MKIGFCFLSIGEINNQKIWQQYFAEAQDYQIFCHIKNDKASTNSDSIFYGTEIEQKLPTTWSKTTQAQMALWSAAFQAECDFAVLLSGDSLPITNFKEFYNFLQQHPQKSIFKWSKPWFPIRNQHLVMGSHQWVVLHRDHLEILSQNKEQIEWIHRTTNHPDNEIFVASSFHKHRCLDDQHVLNKIFLFVDWQRRSEDKKHPYLFRQLDQENLQLLKNKKHQLYFARKFVELIPEDQEKMLQLIANVGA